MADLISRGELLRYVNERIGKIKEIRDSAKANGEEAVFAHCNGEITEARRTKRYLHMFVPLVDDVLVVRCKECKHRGDTYKCPMRRLVLPLDGAGHYVDLTRDDGYCHCGERKEEENHD